MLRVLLRESDPTVRGLLKCFLDNNGYAVTAVSDARSCDTAMMSCRYDVLVADLVLPVLPRDECFQGGGPPRPPLLLMTGYGQQQLAEAVALLRPEGVLQKPFPLHELAVALQGMVRAGSASGPQTAGSVQRSCVPLSVGPGPLERVDPGLARGSFRTLDGGAEPYPTGTRVFMNS